MKEKPENILYELKNTYNILGVKSEFEAEGASFDEVLYMRELTKKLGLKLTLKISGCEAVRDMIDVKRLEPDFVVAPMIESVYALKKYIQTIQSIFSEKEKQKIGFFINIETVSGYENFGKIITSKEFNNISGIVFGRTDMCQSMEISDVNSQCIFDLANSVSSRIENKIFIIGGGINTESVDFLRKIKNLDGFETRKIIFDRDALQNQNLDKAINKALEFELLWLSLRKNKTLRDESRIKELENRIYVN